MEVLHIRKNGRFSLSVIFHFLEQEAFPRADTGYSILGTQNASRTGTRRSGSGLGFGGKWYLRIFPQQFAPYSSISSSISGNNLSTQVNRGCLFSAGIPRAGQRSRSSSFGFFVGWSFFFWPKWETVYRGPSLGSVSSVFFESALEDRVLSFNDLFRRFLRSDILKRTSPAFIPFHKISFLAAYSFFLIFYAVFLQGTLRGFRFRLYMMSIKRQRPEREYPFIVLPQDWLELFVGLWSFFRSTGWYLISLKLP